MRSPPPYDGDPYTVLEWTVRSGRRRLQLEMWRDVPAAVHMTRVSMHTKDAARAYVSWVQSTRIMIEDIVRRESLVAFDERPLRLSARIELAPAFHYRNLKGGKVTEVRTHPARERDLKNLVWALEDAMQGPLYPNDKWIDRYGSISKSERDENRFVVVLSEV